VTIVARPGQGTLSRWAGELPEVKLWPGNLVPLLSISSPWSLSDGEVEQAWEVSSA
jgi:hypothetical protein